MDTSWTSFEHKPINIESVALFHLGLKPVLDQIYADKKIHAKFIITRTTVIVLPPMYVLI